MRWLERAPARLEARTVADRSDDRTLRDFACNDQFSAGSSDSGWAKDRAAATNGASIAAARREVIRCDLWKQSPES
jgi:hypothetical protein